MRLTALPLLVWLRSYDRACLRGDLVAGITIGVMLIPQGMAYAMVAGLPPEYGLYASIFPPLMYALLGSSNKVSLGPVALDAILIISGLRLIAPPGSDHYLELALTLTLLVGAMQLLLGLVRFGFIVNFLSYPVITGYTSAAAVIIIASQLESLVGLDIDAVNACRAVVEVLSRVPEWHIVTLAVGVGSMALIYGLKRWARRLPYAIVVVVVGMVLSGLLGLKAAGVAVVDHIPAGLPALTVPNLSREELLQLLPVAFGVALMGYIGTMSISRSVEQPTDRVSVNANQELIALGAANLLGAFCRAFPVSASFSRSAVFRESGARSPLSAVFSSLLLLLTLLFLAPLFDRYPLPKALLSAIIVMSVYKLVQVGQLRRLYAESRRESTVLLITFCLTLALGVQQGLIIGVLASVLVVIYNSSRPHMAELGLLANDGLYRNIDRFDEAIIREEVLIFRFDATLYFSNADFFKRQLYRWIARRDPARLRAVVFNAESVSSVDSTAILMLIQVVKGLQSRGLAFYITNVKGPVRDRISASALADCLPPSHQFATVEDAVAYLDEGVQRRGRVASQRNPLRW